MRELAVLRRHAAVELRADDDQDEQLGGDAPGGVLEDGRPWHDGEGDIGVVLVDHVLDGDGEHVRDGEADAEQQDETRDE
jgi:hypothetical protein